MGTKERVGASGVAEVQHCVRWRRQRRPSLLLLFPPLARRCTPHLGGLVLGFVGEQRVGIELHVVAARVVTAVSRSVALGFRCPCRTATARLRDTRRITLGGVG